jgi:hypothetical protein
MYKKMIPADVYARGIAAGRARCERHSIIRHNNVTVLERSITGRPAKAKCARLRSGVVAGKRYCEEAEAEAYAAVSEIQRPQAELAGFDAALRTALRRMVPAEGGESKDAVGPLWPNAASCARSQSIASRSPVSNALEFPEAIAV